MMSGQQNNAATPAENKIKCEGSVSTSQMTNRDENNKKSISRRVAKLQNIKHPCSQDVFDLDFHHRMQNPVDNIIEFDGKGSHTCRGYLNNELLSYLSDYFCDDGRHLFGKSVATLIIKNSCLSRYFRGWDQMPDGTPYIAELIKKNPNIKTIDISYTQLGDEEALILIEALAKNTKLTQLKLTGNNISPENIKKIEEKLRENFKQIFYAEVRINARILAQAQRTGAKLFSSLPKNCLIKIAVLTKTTDNFKESEKVASDHFCKPS